MAKRKTKKVESLSLDSNCCKSSSGAGACGGGIYGIGFIGALVYYIQTATGFWTGVLGVLKAVVWPAFLVHKILGM